jgi:peptidoglycan hydrolase-like protein with peptidoglycan-binding domain
MFNKINKTYAGLALALTLAISSAAYSQFSLINGGGGYGYGYGYGVGYGTDAGVYSYRTDGGPADQYAYGYGFVSNTTNGTTSGGGGGGGSYYGGGVYTGSTGTNVISTNPRTCSPYFVKYMRIARANDRAEVSKLQSFLKTYEGETSLPVTGYFGRLTDAAVKRFQAKYGVTPVSGYVFVKTTAKLNEIYCQKVTK